VGKMQQSKIEEKILQMCAGKPMYSLEMRDRLNENQKIFWKKVSLGRIHLALNDLENDGFLYSWYEEQDRPEHERFRRRLYVTSPDTDSTSTVWAS
jgi:DNA-binding PadR family transcriptional regulator